jgi:hypothetical protein
MLDSLSWLPCCAVLCSTVLQAQGGASFLSSMERKSLSERLALLNKVRGGLSSQSVDKVNMIMAVTVTGTVFGTAKPCNPQGSQRLMGYLGQNLHLSKCYVTAFRHILGCQLATELLNRFSRSKPLQHCRNPWHSTCLLIGPYS